MAYQDESDRIRRQMEQGERDLVFAEKQAAIAACYGLPTEGVMDVIRGRCKGVTLTGIDSAEDYLRNPTKAVVPAKDFADAPPNLTDPEFADSALKKLQRLGKLSNKREVRDDGQNT